MLLQFMHLKISSSPFPCSIRFNIIIHNVYIIHLAYNFALKSFKFDHNGMNTQKYDIIKRILKTVLALLHPLWKEMPICSSCLSHSLIFYCLGKKGKRIECVPCMSLQGTYHTQRVRNFLCKDLVRIHQLIACSYDIVLVILDYIRWQRGVKT